MSVTLAQINEKYNDETYPVFPFISKTRITVLPSGLYRKHKATFRGITAIYDTNENKYKYPLYGMYNITDDLIIVPEDMPMSPNKEAFLESQLKDGFTQVSTAPKFETLFFDDGSKEAELALANKLEHQTQLKFQSDNSHSTTVEPDSEFDSEIDGLLSEG